MLDRSTTCAMLLQEQPPLSPMQTFFLPGRVPCRSTMSQNAPNSFFFMHGLEDGVRIDVCIQVKKGIYMYAVDTAGGMAGKAEILRGSEFGLLKKVVVEPSAARQRYPSSVEGKPACLVTEWLKPAGAASRASGLSFARCWFRAGRDGISWSSAQKSSISTLAEEEPLETRKEIRVSAHSRGFVTPPFLKDTKKWLDLIIRI